jgi:tRNA 2-thiouridine synthesizing protein A
LRRRKKERFGTCWTGSGWKRRSPGSFRTVREHQQNGGKQAAASANAKTIDLRGVLCPMNFVHAKLAIEKIRSGERLELYLDEGEPIVNVTRSLKDEGHTVLNVVPENRYFKVVVEKRTPSRKIESGTNPCK